MHNTEYIMKEMWKHLTSLGPDERVPIANKSLRCEPLDFDQQVTFEAAFHIAYNFVHGED